MALAELHAPQRVRKSYPPIAIGDTFDRLTVVGKGADYVSPNGAAFRRWWLQCQCGKTVIRHQSQLHRGHSRDCGCGQRFQTIPIGTMFGLLTVVGDAVLVGRKWKVPCRCDCGRLTQPFSFSLTSEKTKSCGICSRECGASVREAVASATTKHGYHGTPEYRAWCAMKSRCGDPSNKAYRNYGGRGIHVCDEWQHDFAAFLAHIGPKPLPELSIDRIDNERGYEPGNVRWANASMQNRNRRPFLLISGSR